MANFVDVMKQYNRMIEAHRKGVSIPIEASYETAVKQPDFFEECVMEWAAEHPVPVYPTWYEYLISESVLVPRSNYTTYDLNALLLAQLKNTHIHADTAEKLGLQPKEGA